MSCSDDSEKKNLFCPLAWNHAFVNQNGAFQVCCTSEETDNNIRNDRGEVMMITDGLTTEEVKNSTFMKNLRLKLLKGEWPELCRRCEVTEKMGGASRRIIELDHYSKVVDEMVAGTAEDGTSSWQITSADYRLGNVCNLQCRMCNPRSTKLWIRDWNKLKEDNEKFSEKALQSYAKYEWVDSQSLIEDFERKAPHLEQIHFAGGEPLIVPQMAKILRRCIDSGNAGNIMLTYNTNLTILPESVLDLWKHFKEVRILASVDAAGPLNDYIRPPSKWEVIDRNLRFIEAHHKEYRITECLISTTVQALNILALPALYEYLAQFDFIVKAPNLINLHVPYYMQTNVLPIQLKIIAQMELENIQHQYSKMLPEHYQYLIGNIRPIIHMMMSQDNHSQGYFDKMLRFQNGFDEIRKLRLEEYCPEISKFETIQKARDRGP